MSRYRDDREYDEYYPREERYRREALGSYDDRTAGRHFFEEERRPPDYSRNRFGERAEYYRDEPRYRNDLNRFRDEGRSERDDRPSRTRQYNDERSRLRCRDIMTRDLVVATRDTTVREIALMMKQEDTGVIPVVDYDVAGNGANERDERRYDGRNYARGKLAGLITDRDIVIRAIADGKDILSTRAEDITSTSIHTAHPNDRVVDVIRKMGDKQVRRIPVVNENDYLVGMISMADVSNETQNDRELSEALEDISKGQGFWGKFFGDGW